MNVLPALVIGLVFFLIGLLISFALIKAAVRQALSEVTVTVRVDESPNRART